MSVPILSMAFMALAALFCFAMPVLLLIYYKRKGADVLPFFVGCAVFVIFALILPALFVILWANGQAPLPMGLLVLFIAIPVVVITCIVAVLIQRIKEIKGGEEDEAAQY